MVLGLPQEEVQRIMEKGELCLSVFGLGRVGLPLAVAWLRSGQRVIGADIDPSLVDKINSGLSHVVDEPYISSNIRKYVGAGSFRATTDLQRASANSDIKMITVPTTQEGNKGFYDGALEGILGDIGKHLKRGDGVSIECSVPPGTTDPWAKKILEEESGLVADADFGLVFSPQRVYEGRALEDLEVRYPKIVGGVGPRSSELFSTLYRRIAGRGVIEMSSATAAELSKLFEGVYRDVNIALANELAKLCDTLGQDYSEVIGASNSQPFSHLHDPGVGVGGACIPYYPLFILEEARRRGLSLPVTESARVLNERMPGYTISMAERCLSSIGKELKGIRSAILGLSFRGGVRDVRNSPTFDLVDILLERGSEVVVHDPLVLSDASLERRNVRLARSLKEAYRDSSLFIIATDHNEYRDLALEEIARLAETPAVIVDGRNVIRGKAVPEGIILTGIGWGTISASMSDRDEDDG